MESGAKGQAVTRRNSGGGQAAGFNGDDRERLGAAEDTIASLKGEVSELRAMVADIHDALFKPPPEGGPHFFARATTALVAAERANWAAKWLVRGLLTAAAMAAAIKVLWEFARGSGGQ